MANFRWLAANALLEVAPVIKGALGASMPSSSSATKTTTTYSPSTLPAASSLPLVLRAPSTVQVTETTLLPLGGSPTTSSSTGFNSCYGSPAIAVYFPSTTAFLAQDIVTGPDAAARISACLASHGSSPLDSSALTSSASQASSQARVNAVMISTSQGGGKGTPPPMGYPMSACTDGDMLVSCGPQQLSYGAPVQSVNTDVTTTQQKRDVSTSSTLPNSAAGSQGTHKREASYTLYRSDTTAVVPLSLATGPDAAQVISTWLADHDVTHATLTSPPSASHPTVTYPEREKQESCISTVSGISYDCVPSIPPQFSQPPGLPYDVLDSDLYTNFECQSNTGQGTNASVIMDTVDRYCTKWNGTVFPTLEFGDVGPTETWQMSNTMNVTLSFQVGPSFTHNNNFTWVYYECWNSFSKPVLGCPGSNALDEAGGAVTVFDTTYTITVEPNGTDIWKRSWYPYHSNHERSLDGIEGREISQLSKPEAVIAGDGFRVRALDVLTKSSSDPDTVELVTRKSRPLFCSDGGLSMGLSDMLTAANFFCAEHFTPNNIYFGGGQSANGTVFSATGDVTIWITAYDYKKPLAINVFFCTTQLSRIYSKCNGGNLNVAFGGELQTDQAFYEIQINAPSSPPKVRDLGPQSIPDSDDARGIFNELAKRNSTSLPQLPSCNVTTDNITCAYPVCLIKPLTWLPAVNISAMTDEICKNQTGFNLDDDTHNMTLTTMQFGNHTVDFSLNYTCPGSWNATEDICRTMLGKFADWCSCDEQHVFSGQQVSLCATWYVSISDPYSLSNSTWKREELGVEEESAAFRAWKAARELGGTQGEVRCNSEGPAVNLAAVFDAVERLCSGDGAATSRKLSRSADAIPFASGNSLFLISTEVSYAKDDYCSLEMPVDGTDCVTALQQAIFNCPAGSGKTYGGSFTSGCTTWSINLTETTREKREIFASSDRQTPDRSIAVRNSQVPAEAHPACGGVGGSSQGTENDPSAPWLAVLTASSQFCLTSFPIQGGRTDASAEGSGGGPQNAQFTMETPENCTVPSTITVLDCISIMETMMWTCGHGDWAYGASWQHDSCTLWWITITRPNTTSGDSSSKKRFALPAPGEGTSDPEGSVSFSGPEVKRDESPPVTPPDQIAWWGRSDNHTVSCHFGQLGSITDLNNATQSFCETQHSNSSVSLYYANSTYQTESVSLSNGWQAVRLTRIYTCPGVETVAYEDCVAAFGNITELCGGDVEGAAAGGRNMLDHGCTTYDMVLVDLVEGEGANSTGGISTISSREDDDLNDVTCAGARPPVPSTDLQSAAEDFCNHYHGSALYPGHPQSLNIPFPHHGQATLLRSHLPTCFGQGSIPHSDCLSAFEAIITTCQASSAAGENIVDGCIEYQILVDSPHERSLDVVTTRQATNAISCLEGTAVSSVALQNATDYFCTHRVDGAVMKLNETLSEQLELDLPEEVGYALKA